MFMPSVVEPRPGEVGEAEDARIAVAVGGPSDFVMVNSPLTEAESLQMGRVRE